MRGLADTGTLLELRAGFGDGIVTALARIEGRPIGLLANNPSSPRRRDRCRRRRQGCALHAAVRRARPADRRADRHAGLHGRPRRSRRRPRCATCAACSSSAAHLRVPYFAVVLRKGYGLGAKAMTGGGFDAPVFTVAWPTGEFGAMGLEGAVRLGFRKELQALPEGPERDALYERLVAQQYDNGEAINMARDAGDRRGDRPGGNARLARARARLHAGRRARGALHRHVVSRLPADRCHPSGALARAVPTLRHVAVRRPERAPDRLRACRHHPCAPLPAGAAVAAAADAAATARPSTRQPALAVAARARRRIAVARSRRRIRR